MSILSGRLSLVAAISLLITAACSSSTPSSGTTSSSGTPEPGTSGGLPLPVADGGTTVDAAKAPGTIVDVAVKNGSFKTLVELVTLAGLAETLSSAGPFTVLAPNDDAFAKLGAPVLATLKDPANKKLLVQVLSYHVIVGKVPASEVVKLDKKSVATFEGENLGIEVAGSTVTLNKTVKVLATDVAASNGVIHVLDTPLVSPIVAEILKGADGKDIVQTAAATPDLSVLVTCVTNGKLVETLKSAGPFTVFAPTNAAFGNPPAAVTLPEATIAPILTYHVLPGIFGSEALIALNGKTVKTVNGKDLKVKVDGGNIFLVDSVTTSMIKVTALNNVANKNGLVHVIDGVLTP
jgi:transforming growth factor-beta-induced protein